MVYRYRDFIRQNLIVFLKIETLKNQLIKGMKFLKFLGGFLLIFALGCQSAQKLPLAEIMSAEYETITPSEFERGYEVSLLINPISEDLEIKYIILNQKRFEVFSESNSNLNQFRIEEYFPLQSKMIQNFTPPLTDKRKDGIIFELYGEEIYQEIKFKLK
jgi:hypothetical protein